MAFSQRPVTAKIGAVFLLISFIGCFVGTLSPLWYMSGNTYGGIWLQFDTTKDGEIKVYPEAYRTDWHDAVVGLASTGVVWLFVSTCAAFCATRKRVVAVLGIFGGLMVVISVVLYSVYGTDRQTTLGWAFYLSGLSGDLGVIGALLLIPGQYQNAYSAY